MRTLGDVVSDGLPVGYGVKLETPTGKWSRVYRGVGSMWRARGHHTFVVTGEEKWLGNRVTGRRYMDPRTPCVVVRITEAP